MEVNVGDRVSIDSLKVGQPRRIGKVEALDRGLSGVRYTVRWDDGTTTSFSPSGGNLIVERRARRTAKTAKGNAKAKTPKAKASKAKASKTKASKTKASKAKAKGRSKKAKR